jgi:AcrR family transcriptional regulator
MMTRRSSSRKGNKTDRAGQPAPRERILDAASAVFAEHGFAGARVDEIAARAGVNKAMLYYHIGDKTALYTAVLMRNFDRIDEILSTALATSQDPRQRLELFISAITEMTTRYPDHPRIILREIASGAANLPPVALARMLEVITVVRGVLSEGTANGQFRALEPVLTHLTIIGSVLFLNTTAPLRERAAALGTGFKLPEPTTDIATFLIDLLLEGIAAPAGADR